MADPVDRSIRRIAFALLTLWTWQNGAYTTAAAAWRYAEPVVFLQDEALGTTATAEATATACVARIQVRFFGDAVCDPAVRTRNYFLY